MDRYIQNIGFLFLRIFVGGTLLLAHGVPKLLDPKPFIEALTSNGFPLPNIMAYLSISAEAIFPVFIILGVFTRVSALIVAINMFVAAFVFHLNIKGDPFANLEKAFLYMIAFTFIAIAGSGDWTLKRYFDKSRRT
ncbi:MAG TPA: DoxX family protein [Candidatus Brocadiaceae bacterium]|nr:DoxX family protein [Candidatus Brocadiaceae bacterium]